MAIPLNLLLWDHWCETSPRAWDRAAEFVCCCQLDPQNSHSHPLSLELSLSQSLSWKLLGAMASVSCWIQKVLELTASPSVWENTAGCLTFCLCTTCQQSQGTLALLGASGCRVRLRSAELGRIWLGSSCNGAGNWQWTRSPPVGQENPCSNGIVWYTVPAGGYAVRADIRWH